mgnify:CR=1 FL=1
MKLDRLDKLFIALIGLQAIVVVVNIVVLLINISLK